MFLLIAFFMPMFQDAPIQTSKPVEQFIAASKLRFEEAKKKLDEEKEEIQETLRLMRTKAVFLGDKFKESQYPTFPPQGPWRIQGGKVETVNKKTLAGAISVEKQKLASVEAKIEKLWESPPFAIIRARTMQTADCGVLLSDVEVIQVLEPGSILGLCDGEVLIIRGLDTDDLVDGRVFEIIGLLYVAGTENYDSVGGARKTVFSLKALSKEDVRKAIDGFKQSLPPKPTKFRDWASVDGKFTTNAEFVLLTKTEVTLKKADGKEITVPLSKLSKDDRTWLKENADESPAK